MSPKEYEKPTLRESTINGYLYFIDPNHPLAFGNAHCVYDHRHEASVKLDRWLREDEVVHHKDGNRANNRHDNLEVLGFGTHSQLHHEALGHRLRREAICPICGTHFTSRSGKGKVYCSIGCLGHANRRTPWPSRKQLQTDMQSLSWLAIGRKYGVSDNAVRKWARKYGLLK